MKLPILVIMFIIAVIIVIMISVSFETDGFKDERDGRIYRTVRIGDQVWMAENLNYAMVGSRCFEDNPAYCETYGQLYTWRAAMMACPRGWHLPSNDEWGILYKFVDDPPDYEEIESPYENYTAGRYLKAQSGWEDDGNGKDRYDFAALPGGTCYHVKNFDRVGTYGYWWTSSDTSVNEAYYQKMDYQSEGAYRYIDDKTFMYSVRCLQDKS